MKTLYTGFNDEARGRNSCVTQLPSFQVGPPDFVTGKKREQFPTSNSAGKENIEKPPSTCSKSKRNERQRRIPSQNGILMDEIRRPVKQSIKHLISYDFLSTLMCKAILIKKKKRHTHKMLYTVANRYFFFMLFLIFCLSYAMQYMHNLFVSRARIFFCQTSFYMKQTAI